MKIQIRLIVDEQGLPNDFYLYDSQMKMWQSLLISSVFFILAHQI